MSSDLKMDVYLSGGQDSDPNEYTHDFAMKNIRPFEQLTLDSSMIPAMARSDEGFTVNIFLYGHVERENKLLYGNLVTEFY